MHRIRRALISVSDKRGIVDFARQLYQRDIELISTGGTAKALCDALIPVVEVADYTGSPEILDGRLKTLHPKIHGGILGRRSHAQHVKEMEENAIGPIDLIIVNLYPFERTVAQNNCAFDDAIENIDIGGPTMVRAAAKNYTDVAVVSDPEMYSAIIEAMDAHEGGLPLSMRFHLMKKAFAMTARYDAAIATYLSAYDDDHLLQEMPQTIGQTYELVQPLRYGENPQQKAAFYREVIESSEPSLVHAKQLQGKELSYNNIMDADATIAMVREYDDAPFACVIVKHANPCGAALSSTSMDEAFEKALQCDSTSAFGGIIACNREIDAKTAEKISSIFFEVIVAPHFSEEAKEILGKKKNLRLLELSGLGDSLPVEGFDFRKVVGGMLVQTRDSISEVVRDAQVVTKRSPSDEEWAALDFSWRICRHVKSNAIVFAAKDRTLGIGAGQMSRVDASKIAVMKASQSLKGSVVASDAFFPFRDGVDAAAEAGAKAIIQPGGSRRDDEVIQAADEHDIAMVFTARRHFRH
jgi:phosphoribosylaminoimidazolecarboxamide formyltransferase/IMP cyclohydrolase